MDAAGRSDAATRLPGWLEEAGFAEVDPGERRLGYSGDELGRQAAYAASVIESTLPALTETSDATAAQLEAGLAELRALATIPDAALGWVVHKAKAVR
jgi:hypothetical protein